MEGEIEMPVAGAFIDSDIFIAARNADDKNHKRAVELLTYALEGRLGDIYTSDFIFHEAVMAAIALTKNVEYAIDIGEFIMATRRIRILYTDSKILMDAWKLFKKYGKQGLTLTDCITIALMKEHKITRIISFNRKLDVVPWIERIY